MWADETVTAFSKVLIDVKFGDTGTSIKMNDQMVEQLLKPDYSITVSERCDIDSTDKQAHVSEEAALSWKHMLI